MSNRARLVVVLALVAIAALAWLGLEGTPPNLELSGLPGASPVSGNLEILVAAADDRTGVEGVEASIDGTGLDVVRTERGRFSVRIDTAALGDGSHRLEVWAIDRSLRRNERRLGVSVRTDNTPPSPVLARSSTAVGQGQTLAILARFGEPVTGARARLLGQDVTMAPVADELWRALFGIAIEQEPGSWTLEVTATDEAGNAGRLQTEVQVGATAFEEGGFIRLTDRQTAARQDRSAADTANDRRRRAYGAEVDQTRWTGRFDRPSEGPRTSPFGKFRTYSDGRTKHHKGTDIAAPRGTPVHAPAGGVVTLAEELHIYGNAVILKHGPRVSSSYNHLSAIEVEVGDVVERGQIVGRVGSTGQSTGPHLHWGMVVGGVAVDAEQWTTRDFGTPLPDDFGGE